MDEHGIYLGLVTPRTGRRRADRAEPVELERVGLAIAALRLGDDPGIAERWHAAAPEGPGPWFRAAQLSVVGRS